MIDIKTNPAKRILLALAGKSTILKNTLNFNDRLTKAYTQDVSTPIKIEIVMIQKTPLERLEIPVRIIENPLSSKELLFISSSLNTITL